MAIVKAAFELKSSHVCEKRSKLRICLCLACVYRVMDDCSTVATILRSTVIGSQSVKGCKGFKPIIVFIGCHIRYQSLIKINWSHVLK